MEIGVGLDASLGMSWADQANLSREAARLGYTSLWTPEGNGQDSFHLCVQRWMASRDVVPEGLETGIGVSPVMYRTPLSFAMAGGTVSEITGGRFIMGIGTGAAYRPRARRALGVGRMSALALMRDYLMVIRGLLAGERVSHEGETVTLRGMRLGISPPPRTPVYLGGAGPQDAGAFRGAGGRGVAELVYTGADRLESGADRRWGRPSGPPAVGDQDGRVHPHLRG